MNKPVYCIHCEEMVVPEDGGNMCHAIEEEILTGTPYNSRSISFCDFPMGFAYCPPQELEDDWQDHMREPEDEVIAPANVKPRRKNTRSKSK